MTVSSLLGLVGGLLVVEEGEDSEATVAKDAFELILLRAET